MALPTNETVATLDYPYNGEPFNRTASKSSVDTSTLALDYPYNGEPFVGQPFSAAVATAHAIVIFIGI